jgi:hypothetical protein
VSVGGEILEVRATEEVVGGIAGGTRKLRATLAAVAVVEVLDSRREKHSLA